MSLSLSIGEFEVIECDKLASFILGGWYLRELKCDESYLGNYDKLKFVASS